MANSPRPGVWVLEKSSDHGKTFQPWQYFADTPSDCYNFFSTYASKRIETDDDIICTTDYSKVLPLEGGEVIFF
jgi:laminin alpha 3/5